MPLSTLFHATVAPTDPVFYGFIPVATAISTLALIAWLLRGGRALPFDHPNERSLHAAPVPRVGGAAMFMILVPALLLLGWQLLVVALVAVLAALSFLDDRKGVPIVVRFGAHGLAAALFVFLTMPEIGVVPAAMMVIAVVWMTNLYNFMDGSDGLAGGMALFGFGTYAVIALLKGAVPFAAANAAIAASAAAFLIFNFHPAKVFLGDAGSIPLGFLAGAIGLSGWRDGYWPLWLPLLAFAPFVCDASLTLLKRLLRGERVWRAHRDHYYQRLVRMGFGHRGTAIVEYMVMAGCAVIAMLASDASLAAQTAAVAGAAAVLIALAAWVDIRWSRFEHARRGVGN